MENSKNSVSAQSIKNQILKMQFQGWNPVKNEIKFIKNIKEDFYLRKIYNVSIVSSCNSNEMLAWEVEAVIDTLDNTVMYHTRELKSKIK